MALFGGYSEVAAYSQNPNIFFEEEEEVVWIPELPPHLTPHNLVQHPWKWHASFMQDFILIAEFSEQEGPRPLITIPTDGEGKFDLNAFAVKIMAVDYQMLGSSNFTVAGDTQIVLEEEKERAHAYVHHFTLYDTEARGFVRPFCMAYVTPDRRKIMDNFEELLKEFRKVSNYFKYGNRLIFVKDLEHTIEDLQYTKEVFNNYHREVTKTPEQDNPYKHTGSDIYEYFMYATEETFDHQIEELKNMLNAIKPLLTNTKLEDRFKRLEEKARRGKHYSTPFQFRSTFHEDGYHSDNSEIPVTPTKSRRRTTPPFPHEDQGSEYRPKLVKIDTFRRFDQTLRTLHELCYWGAKEGLNKCRKIHQCYSRDPMTVSFESRESQLIEPPSTLLTLGRSVAINFLHKIDLSSAINCWPLYEVYKTKLRSDSVSGYSSHSDKRWLTENRKTSDIQIENLSLSSLETIDSYISYSDDGGERIPRSSYNAAFVLGSAFVSLESLYYDVEENPYSDSSDSEYDVITNSSGSHVDGSYISQQNVTDSMVNLLDIENSGSMPKSTDVQSFLAAGSVDDIHNNKDTHTRPIASSNHFVDGAGDINSHHSVDSTEDSHIIFTEDLDSDHSPASGASATESSPEGDVHLQVDGQLQSKKAALMVVTEDSAPLSHEQPNEKCPRIPVGSCADHIFRFNPNLPGAGVLKFVHHYVYAAHIIYALLSGRPVVVLGSAKYEKEVRSLITTLWLFVPGHSSRYHVVVPWHTLPLTLADLGKMKLVGLCKGRSPRSPNVLPSSVRRYVTVLDYDKNTLCTPPYKGFYINTIVSRKKQFKTDQVFLAYIHSILLELASKAYLYYHSFCLNSTSIKSSESSRSPTKNLKPSMSGYLSKLGLVDSDAKIVEYFVELIKQQQVDDFIARVKGYCSHDQLPSPTIRIDYKQSQEYRV
ncbi:guanine nucleotide exchange protein smcr8a-like [Glandiceps talaboti]